MSKIKYKIWHPTGETREIAGGTVNGWEAVDVIN